MQGKTEDNKDASIQIGGLIYLLTEKSQDFYLDLVKSPYPVDKYAFHKEILEVIKYEISESALQSEEELSLDNLQQLQLGVTIETQDAWRKRISERREAFPALLDARKKTLTQATVNKKEGSLISAVEEKPSFTKTTQVQSKQIQESPQLIAQHEDDDDSLLNEIEEENVTTQITQAQSDQNQKPLQLEVKKGSKFNSLISGLFISIKLSVLSTLVASVIFLSIPSGILPAIFIPWCCGATLGLSIGLSGFLNIIDEGGLTFSNGSLWGLGVMLIGTVIGCILGTCFLPGVGTLSGATIGTLVGAGFGFLAAVVAGSVIDCVLYLLKEDNNVAISQESEEDSETKVHSQMSALGSLKKTPDETVREIHIQTHGSGELFVNLDNSEKNRKEVDENDSRYIRSSKI